MNKRFITIFLFIFIFFSFTFCCTAYQNHCWNDDSPIDSAYCDKCSVCGWYICNTCGGCSVGNFHKYEYNYYDNTDYDYENYMLYYDDYNDINYLDYLDRQRVDDWVVYLLAFVLIGFFILMINYKPKK